MLNSPLNLQNTNTNNWGQSEIFTCSLVNESPLLAEKRHFCYQSISTLARHTLLASVLQTFTDFVRFS
jgi:hypothetical protein